METAAFLTSCVGTLLYLLSFYDFNRNMLKGRSLPNPATWSLWAYLAVMNAATYLVMTGSVIASIQTFGGAAANLTTFYLAWKFGKFRSLKKEELGLLASGIVAGMMWSFSRSATVGNVIIVSCFLTSILPTIKDVYRKLKREHPRPWIGWGISYAFQVVALIFLRAVPGAYVLPIVAGISQLTVGLLALRRPKSGHNIP